MDPDCHIHARAIADALNRFDKNGRPQKRDEEAGEIIHSIDVAAPAADNLNTAVARFNREDARHPAVNLQVRDFR